MKILHNVWIWYAMYCIAVIMLVTLATPVLFNYAVQWAVGQSDSQSTTSGSSLIELWSRDSYAETQAKAVFENQPTNLFNESPVLSDGLERVQ